MHNIFKICVYFYILFNCVHVLADLKEYTTALENYKQASDNFKKAYKNSFDQTQKIKQLQKQTSQELQQALEELQKYIAGYKIPTIKCDDYDYICNSTFYFTQVKKFIKVIEKQHSNDHHNIKQAHEQYDQAIKNSTENFLKAVKQKEKADKQLDKATKKMNKALEEYRNTRFSCGWLMRCETKHGIAREVNRFLTILNITTDSSNSESKKAPKKSLQQ